MYSSWSILALAGCIQCWQHQSFAALFKYKYESVIQQGSQAIYKSLHFNTKASHMHKWCNIQRNLPGQVDIESECTFADIIFYLTHKLMWKVLARWLKCLIVFTSLVSRPFPIFVLWFAFSIIHRNRKAVKNREGLGTVIHDMEARGQSPATTLCTIILTVSFLPVKQSTHNLA